MKINILKKIINNEWRYRFVIEGDLLSEKRWYAEGNWELTKQDARHDLVRFIAKTTELLCYNKHPEVIEDDD
jgi:hypothetical protein